MKLEKLHSIHVNTFMTLFQFYKEVIEYLKSVAKTLSMTYSE